MVWGSKYHKEELLRRSERAGTGRYAEIARSAVKTWADWLLWRSEEGWLFDMRVEAKSPPKGLGFLMMMRDKLRNPNRTTA